MTDFDVAVVGGGPAGSATARRLALDGYRVVVLERSRFSTPRVGESLSPAVTPSLRALGVREPFDALGPRPSYGVRSSWGTDSSSSTLSDPHGPGWYVDRAAFDRMLASAAEAAGASVRLGVVCREVRPGGAGWTLRLSTGGEVSARVVVDATGRAARLGRRRDAERIAFDRLVAVTGFAPDPDPGGFGLVETVPEGWWYCAPAGAGRLVAMLLTDADLARSGRLTTSSEWAARLGPRTAERVGPAGTLRVVPARSHRLHRREFTEPWVAVGDAAFAVDPITGDGVAKALRGAADAAGAVVALLGGDTGPLRAYEDALDRETTAYLHRRADFYAAEDRWPDAEFWRRRHAVAARR
ncbi:NAD(P)/FAD-dependent oxidoreductase [Cryptosporangium phraense]|uniref:NAD(P)/FAD-dependent oxidoreductase n=1 Tax=Cryptosporangium phraense TaxID=2593070 RepID=UPI00147853E0|nr:NAD(P)/FAD-dependent oxidoreductase [Cryptosporangium phraense]